MNHTVELLEIPASSAAQFVQRIEQLAQLSESTKYLSRRFATKEHRLANDLVAQWMHKAGMTVKEDDMGNIIGRYEGEHEGSAAIMLGSHLDTVVDAGKYDGMLGVLSGIACVEALQANQLRLPYAIEVVGFADEEGVRFQSTYLGSRAIAGTLDPELLNMCDKDGITVREALIEFGKNPDNLASATRSKQSIKAYLELHIEQGPVLEQRGIPVGVVSAIAGATRLNVRITGEAGHAGTVPMSMRQDALACAAKCVSGIESICSGAPDLVGTVGRMQVGPGAGNVLPGLVDFSVDIRAAEDTHREQAVSRVMSMLQETASERGVRIKIDKVHEATSVECHPEIIKHLCFGIESEGGDALILPSGAGHDAAAMAAIAPVGMLFVRCEKGISHNPAESVLTEDMTAGAQVMLSSVLSIAAQ